MKGCSAIDGWPFIFFMENQKEIRPVSNTFKKEERLCSKKVIDQLFLNGKSFLVFPVKVVYHEIHLPVDFPVQAGFSVSKKVFKRAVHRNRMKRLMREAYRLNKNELYIKIGTRQVAVFFIFVGKELMDYPVIEKSIKKSIQRISASLSKLSDNK